MKGVFRLDLYTFFHLGRNGKDAESEEAQEHANSSSLAVYA